jgi:hypothetical protein
MAGSSERRPAPTIAELWASDPELLELQQELLGSADADERLWALTPQTPVSPDASFDELPETIERQCCYGKSCGATTLVKVREQGVLEEDGYSKDGVQGYGYSRQSNGDPYFDFASVEELVAALNDPRLWPNRK